MPINKLSLEDDFPRIAASMIEVRDIYNVPRFEDMLFVSVARV